MALVYRLSDRFLHTVTHVVPFDADHSKSIQFLFDAQKAIKSKQQLLFLVSKKSADLPSDGWLCSDHPT